MTEKELQEKADKYQEELAAMHKKLSEKYGFAIIQIIVKKQSADTGFWFDAIENRLVEYTKEQL